MPRKSHATPPTRGKSTSSRAARKAHTASAVQPARAALATPAGPATLLQGPLGLAAVWTQFAEQMQRASEQTWQGLRHDMEVEAEDVEQADTPQQLTSAPIGFAAEQATRWAQLSTQMTTSLLDAQAAWLKEVESMCTQMIGPLFAHNGRIALASAQDLVEPPGPQGPMQLLWSAQKMWSEGAKVWLHAMSHDLQADTPPARSA